jgi:hypothetical protein
LVTRSAAGYNYRGNWASSRWQDFHLLERQLASLQLIVRLYWLIHRKTEQRGIRADG